MILYLQLRTVKLIPTVCSFVKQLGGIYIKGYQCNHIFKAEIRLSINAMIGSDKWDCCIGLIGDIDDVQLIFIARSNVDVHNTFVINNSVTFYHRVHFISVMHLINSDKNDSVRLTSESLTTPTPVTFIWCLLYSYKRSILYSKLNFSQGNNVLWNDRYM